MANANIHYLSLFQFMTRAYSVMSIKFMMTGQSGHQRASAGRLHRVSRFGIASKIVNGKLHRDIRKLDDDGRSGIYGVAAVD